MRATRWLGTGGCLVALLFTGAARAQTPPNNAANSPATPANTATSTATPAPTPQPTGTPAATPPSGVRASQEHLNVALERYAAHDYRAAVHEFELAYQAAPQASILYNMARAYELMSEFTESIRYYQQYLRDHVDAPDREFVERHIRELNERAEAERARRHTQRRDSSMAFDVNVPGAEVFVNERSVGRSPLAESVRLDPGTYALRVTAARMQDWSASVRLRRGDDYHAFVQLRPETRFATRRAGHLASYIIGGVGVAAAGAGIVLGVRAALTPVGPDECGNVPNTFVAQDCPRRQNATYADISFAASAGLLLTAAIVYFVEAGASRTERVTEGTPATP